MYLNDYLNKLMRVWNAQEGLAVARFVSLQDHHVKNANLYKEYPEDAVCRTVPEPLDEIVYTHLRVVYQLKCANPPDYNEAYRHQTSCIQAVVKLLQHMKEENWILPIMYVVAIDLRLLATKCEQQARSSKAGKILEKAAESLLSCFRVCAGDTRSADEDTKRLGMLHIVNQLLKVYFRINKLHLCKPLIRAIDSSNFRDAFSLAQRITFKYFAGRKAMYDSDFGNADELLSFAFNHCPARFTKNKRLILTYLAPVKMLLGYMPRKEVLERYNVPQFHDLAAAVREGNVRRFDETIARHELFFISAGIYLIVQKLKILTYRNLCRKVHLLLGVHQLDMEAFETALRFSGIEDITIEETHCIVANLIYDGRIKGYISFQHNKLVLSKQNPFPLVSGT
ncbi:PCI domain-containing protein 2 homolog [Anopheles aquasalis]|uniref:PCI domain-containing protein 2 homolog n=1 Tax=Anopheles aquasalis TaxID=42839 RepID=UPI00215AB4FF|nr:PCI domain-containing protein 2 homolog [Anopheles aquasalis]